MDTCTHQKHLRKSLLAAAGFITLTSLAAPLTIAADEILIIEEDDEVVIEGDTTALDEGDMLIIDEGEIPEQQAREQAINTLSTGPTTVAANTVPSTDSPVSLGIDKVWLEYGAFTRDDAVNDTLGHLRSEVTLNWSARPHWETRLSARVYGYQQSGNEDFDEIDLDYGETYIRHIGESYRLTIGAQEVIWGRIDEFPPSDRLSTQDISRYVIDDLSDRRRASPAIRYEYFWNNSTLDLLINPYFRPAELPDRNSVWFPVNQDSGEIFGLASTAVTRQLVKNARIQLDEPDGEGGFGLRYSTILSGFDYALTVQKGKQNLPYFIYDAAKAQLETIYPDSWSAGGDMGFEALGGTLRFEALWSNDTPVTKTDGSYTLVDSIAWGVALEVFPGDGDSRVNIQLMGNQLLTDTPTIDRDETYAFFGSYEAPFSNERWRFKTRFYAGLDEKDWYLNPELAYTAITDNEFYIEFHYFDGAKGTPGGFHQDNSFVAVGWRITL